MDSETFTAAIRDGAGQKLYVTNDLDFTIGNFQAFERRLAINLIARTGYMFRNNAVQLPQDVSGMPDFVRIACVSSQISIKEEPPAGKKKRTAVGRKLAKPDLFVAAARGGCQIVKATGALARRDLVKIRSEELREALNFKPHIICFPELAYPGMEYPDEPSHAPERNRRHVEMLLKYDASVRSLIQEEVEPTLKPFAFLGSYHCAQSLHNVGVLYPYGTDQKVKISSKRESFDPAEGEADGPKEEVIDLPVLQKKRFPARSSHEEIRVPNGMDFTTYKTSIGTICVLICSDIVDANQFLSVIRYNNASGLERIDYVLVPSYNEHEAISSMCGELSYAANCTVINVNCNFHVANFPRTTLFITGYKYQGEKNSDHVVKVTEKNFFASYGNGKRRKSKLIGFEINPQELHKVRTKMSELTRASRVTPNLEMSQGET